MSGLARARAALQRTLAIARKEFRQLARDRMTLGFVVGIPSLQLILFGYAINLDVRHVPTAVLDQDRSSLSRKVVGELEATQTFRVTRDVARPGGGLPPAPERTTSARWWWCRRTSSCASSAGAARTSRSSPTPATRPSPRRSRRPARASTAGSPSASSPSGRRARRRRCARLRGTPPRGAPCRIWCGRGAIRIEVLPLYNPERRTPVFIVPGLVGVILTMTMMLMTALAVVRERERGTFEFLIATPGAEQRGDARQDPPLPPGRPRAGGPRARPRLAALRRAPPRLGPRPRARRAALPRGDALDGTRDVRGGANPVPGDPDGVLLLPAVDAALGLHVPLRGDAPRPPSGSARCCRSPTSCAWCAAS